MLLVIYVRAAKGNTFPGGGRGTTQWWMRRRWFLQNLIRAPSPNNATSNPFFSAHAAGAITFALVGKRSLATQVHKNAARELRPLDSAAVCGRLCDEFGCGDFCVCYSGCLFRVKTEVVSRMALCGIWWRRGRSPVKDGGRSKPLPYRVCLALGERCRR